MTKAYRRVLGTPHPGEAALRTRTSLGRGRSRAGVAGVVALLAASSNVAARVPEDVVGLLLRAVTAITDKERTTRALVPTCIAHVSMLAITRDWSPPVATTISSGRWQGTGTVRSEPTGGSSGRRRLRGMLVQWQWTSYAEGRSVKRPRGLYYLSLQRGE